jgi:hypothetical protein
MMCYRQKSGNLPISTKKSAKRKSEINR